MKIIITFFALCLVAVVTAKAQSESFLTFKEKFEHHDDAFAFSTNAFLMRTILGMTVEREIKEAIRSIKHVRIATVPKSAFKAENVTVDGYRKVIQKDSFDEMIRAKDHGEDVTIYVRSTQSKNNSYLILVDEPDDVTVIEIKGYIDPQILLDNGYSPNSNSKKST